MGTAILHFDSWALTWREFWQKFAWHCAGDDCRHRSTVWRHVWGKPLRVFVHGSWYCLDDCLERTLVDALRRAQPAFRRLTPHHRIPLGLLLLSRQQLTAEQLRTALAKQQAAGRGRIGEWLQTLGFVTEHQVTAALARQWSCPLLRSVDAISASGRLPQVPRTLLKSFAMIPVDYVEATATLHIAFGEGIDYSVLYAIEQMIGCHTEPCMALPSALWQSLQARSNIRAENEVVFDRVDDVSEFARIIRSYSARVSATEIRLASCGSQIWVRLLRSSGSPMDLLLRTPHDAAPAPLAPMQPHSIAKVSRRPAD